jgi:aminoglycoside phosphotransferase (APT) family kinase protein
MEVEIIDQQLELAAKRVLNHITGTTENLKPLYLQPDRAIFLAENLHMILKVYMAESSLQHDYDIAQKAASIGIPTPKILGFQEGQPAVFAMQQVIGCPLSSHNPVAAKEAGRYLRHFHTLEASPPFSGGQNQWDTFISWWIHREMENIKIFQVLDALFLSKLQEQLAHIHPLLAQRPIVLLHGDLQPEHILVDSQTEKVLAFIDFVDAQPGDPLLDIAVLTLWDHELTDFLLDGYSSIVLNAETLKLLSFYRHLRHVAEIPWLLARGFNELAERDIKFLKESLAVRDC